MTIYRLLCFKKMYYYEETGQCFELYERGPCNQGHILSFNYATLQPECKCQEDHHLHADGNCYRLNTKGKHITKSKHVLVPKMSTFYAVLFVKIGREFSRFFFVKSKF